MTVPYRHIAGPFRRTIVVGDIHGCWDEFRRLLEATAFSAEDVLVTVGDFMDRGPGSWDLARFFKQTPNAFSVIGNHERRVAGVVRGRSKPAWSQEQSLSLIPDGEHADWAAWLESLPAVIETPHAIVTHARLDPARALTEQDAYHTVAVGGAAVTIDLDGDGVPLWFRQMRFDKPVCMGHIGYVRVALVPEGLYALDTGAVRGGQLTAVVFPGGALVQTPVVRNYHDEAYKAWRSARLVPFGDPAAMSASSRGTPPTSCSGWRTRPLPDNEHPGLHG
jgi:serine/threonine protein phosphatase 1